MTDPSPVGATRSLTLATPLDAGQRISLEVTVGTLMPGQAIRVDSSTGEALGMISPFGPESRRRSATYALPVDVRQLRGSILTVTLTVVQAGHPPRAPTAAEVEDLKLVGLGPPD